MKDADYIGATVEFDFGYPALSCCTNGGRMRGVSKVVDEDIGGGLCLANGKRIFQHEIIKIVDAGSSDVLKEGL